MHRGLNASLAITAALSLAYAAGARADLATYGYSNARTGAMVAHGAVAPTAAPRLKPIWRASVGGAVNAQPLAIDNVQVHAKHQDVVVVGTEHGAVVALEARSGRVLWRRQLGHRRISPACQSSPDGEFGVTGTPVVDPRAGRVYAVDVNGRAWALALGSGTVVQGWPQRVHPTDADFVWGALALSRGSLYIPIASLCDSGRYDGGIVSVNVKHPSRTRRWRTTAGTAAYAGGIWGWGGISIDSGTGDVFGATGNSLGTADEATPHAESVVRLSSGLVLRQANDPLLGAFTSMDRDFGTTPVLIHAAGCPPQAVAINKDGELFLYDRSSISSGPAQRLRVASGSPNQIPLYGMPAWDPTSRTLVLVSPSAALGGAPAGVQAFTLGTGCRFALSWQQAFDFPNAGSAPTIAGSVIFIATGRNGRVRAYRLRDGRPLWARHFSHQAMFAAPAVDRGSLYVADWGGHVWRVRPR